MNKFLKNNLVFMASTMAGGLLGYFFHFIVSRRLSVAAYGELQAVISLSLFLSVFSMALSFFIIKYSSVLASRNDRAGQIRFLSFLFKKFRQPVFGIFLIFVLLAPFLKNILHLTDFAGLFAVGASAIFSFFSAFYLNALQGWKKFSALGAIGVLAVAVKLLTGWLLAASFHAASAVSFSILISSLAGWILVRSYSRRQWAGGKFAEAGTDWREKHFSGENFRKSFFQILFFSLALAAVSNLDIIVVKNLASPDVAGFYAALSVLGKVVMWFNLAVVGVLLPEAFSLGYDGKPVNLQTITGSYALIFLVSLPLLAAYRFFSGSLVGLLFGEKYIGVSQSLWLFGFASLALSLLLLEAKMAMARNDFRSTWFLSGVVAVLAAAIYFFHSDLREIVWSVIISFLLGWVSVFLLNLANRYKREAVQERL